MQNSKPTKKYYGKSSSHIYTHKPEYAIAENSALLTVLLEALYFLGFLLDILTMRIKDKFRCPFV